ncbi:MAG: 16S rRNA (adenine(1518)-N(6)/adenine(1519)-N(6))-dimethyltransferase RsmA [Deltaproteobacteria bacterium]|nr:16S rRNA (adenine(1518)-N(6)/adenine(1519)-N(6))-dimethyltransferase RsmA [Deltaproteobacteria bacterium]
MRDSLSLIKQYRIRPKHKLGQNFLAQPDTAERILDAAGFDSEDTVIEIGAGLGGLTIPLARRVRRVIALEFDRDLVAALNDQLSSSGPSNITLVEVDALKYDFTRVAHELQAPVKVIGNLPYYISSPLLFKLLDHRQAIAEATLMFQREVADRLAASPGGKDYGALTVMVAYFATVTTLFHLSPDLFHPRPKVSSALTKIIFKPSINLRAQNEAIFSRVVKGAFGQRRKTLLNALAGANLPGLPKEMLKETLELAEIDGRRRGETLTVEEFVRLADVVSAAVTA